MMKIQKKKKTIKPHYVEEIHSKSLSSFIWKDLPREVLENVLACLPAHVLCRFRLVCKEWNHLISQPSFAVLRALSLHKASSIFIFPKLTFTKMLTSAEWHILYPTKRCPHELSNSFKMDSQYLFNTKNKGLRDKGWFKCTLPVDEGLIYTMYIPSDQPTIQMHIVCNLISKSFYKIPELPEIFGLYHHNIVVMSVDKSRKNYKIVAMEMCMDMTKPVFLYESMTRAWRTLCEAPDSRFSAYSSILMKGIFYTLFVDLCGIPTWPISYTVLLYSCDLVTGAWCKVDVNFPPLSTIEEYPQLVVSLGRLYMVNFTKCKKPIVMLSIWEIVLEKMEVVEVVKIPNFCKLFKSMTDVSDMPVAVGCVDSIIISCKEGCCKKFDLLKKHWQELPGHPLDRGSDILPASICACLLDL